MFKLKCRCGKTEKSFKNDLNLEFFIAECCEKAGYDYLGNKKLECKECNECKDCKEMEGKHQKPIPLAKILHKKDKKVNKKTKKAKSKK